jgi:hypothetical protein
VLIIRIKLKIIFDVCSKTNVNQTKVIKQTQTIKQDKGKEEEREDV